MEEVSVQPSVSETMNNSDEEKVWRTHAENFLKYSGSVRNYCRAHKLNASIFRIYKKKFGIAKPRGKYYKSFIKVEDPQPSRTEAKFQKVGQALPEAKWVAEFVSHLMRLM